MVGSVVSRKVAMRTSALLLDSLIADDPGEGPRSGHTKGAALPDQHPSSETPRRRRRSPGESRRRLLATAEALIADRGPDAVTLRDVAEAAGVTAGLVTHYFGTRDALVREVLRRQDLLTRARFRRKLGRGAEVPDADALLRLLFKALSESSRVRLFVWAHLRGDPSGGSSGGVRDLVDALEDRFRRTLPAAQRPHRARIELVALLALSAIHGWAVGKRAWLRGLGLGAATVERDEEFLAGLVTALRDLMARSPPAPAGAAGSSPSSQKPAR